MLRRTIVIGFLLTLLISVFFLLPMSCNRDSSTPVTKTILPATTSITAHPWADMKAEQNLIYCGTMKLAWNQAAKLVGGKLQFAPPYPKAVETLSENFFSTTDLDEPSYYVAAGFFRDGILERIPKELQQKFQGHATPQLIPSPQGMHPQDLIAYAYLEKNLRFATPFLPAKTPLTFANNPIKSFGIKGSEEPERYDLAKQIIIHDYTSPDDFVIELKTTSPQDHLILAKIAPQDTLAATFAAVQKRISSKIPSSLESYNQTHHYPAAAEPRDTLQVPIMNFDLTREYKEFYGLRLLPTIPGMADNLEITSMQQNIRFKLDEVGADLKSDAHLLAQTAAPFPDSPPRIHQLVFDKPFLLLLTHANSSHPYLALWIANPELLITAK